MRTIFPPVSRVVLFLVLTGIAVAAHPQTRSSPSSPPLFEILNYNIEAVLTPDAHEIEAKALITFRTVEQTDFIVFEISENLVVQKVLNAEGVEMEFGQDEIGPGYLTVRFPDPLAPGTSAAISIEYEGGFDRDRFSRLYTRDESSAYIGMEGTYLLHSAKWIPIRKLLADRSKGQIEITVPLGMTVIGPGVQMPVTTKGITETFGWKAEEPVLQGSFVAGQYSQTKIQIGDYTFECYTKEGGRDSIQRFAEAAAKILKYYSQSYGPASSGEDFRLVEVDDQLARRHGMLGSIFITRRELRQPAVPIRELARRIAYQWWHETVGVRNPGDLWLEDGMAYYSAAHYLGEFGGASAYREEIDNLAVLALKFESKSAVRNGLDLGYGTDKYESVVAGKGAWVLNMLRGVLGESKFTQLIRQYFRKYAGVGGSTSALRKLAEEQYGRELEWFFSEWIDTIGVPELQADYVVYKTATGFRVSGTIRQDRDLFRMPVEVVVTGGDREEKKTIEVVGKSAAFDIVTLTQPEKVILDPGNNLLRDSRELQTSVQLTLGNDLKQNGNFVEAIRAYEAALKLSPHRSIVHFQLAETFYEQFNYQSAANSFRDALNGDKDPKWIEVWSYIYLGKIYDILGQRQRAMAEYTKALNTKDDTNGAQAEAGKWLAAPFTRERTTVEKEQSN
ncbi:MAG: tetratricopeptide repeat protein [Acidobacteria bacterium]|nr:tetratricopeptide repeat protein [Acidobacteriota bacterium]